MSTNLSLKRVSKSPRLRTVFLTMGSGLVENLLINKEKTIRVFFLLEKLR